MRWIRGNKPEGNVIKVSRDKCREIATLKHVMKRDDDERKRNNEITDALQGYGGINLMMPSLQPAQKSDYVKWLQTAIDNGAMPTEFINREFDKCNNMRFMVTTGDIEIFPLLPAQSLHIIVRNDHNVEYASEKYRSLYENTFPSSRRVKFNRDLGSSSIYLPSGDMYRREVSERSKNVYIPMFIDILIVCE